MVDVLDHADVDLFYKLYLALMFFVYEQTGAIEKEDIAIEEFMDLPPQERLKVHEALYNKKELIDQFIQSREATLLTKDELDIIFSWKYFKKGKFFLYRHLKKYSIFLDDLEVAKAYGVYGIYDPLNKMFPSTPILLQQFCFPLRNTLYMMELSYGTLLYLVPGLRGV